MTDVVDERYICRDCGGPLRYWGGGLRCINARAYFDVHCGGFKPRAERPKDVHKLACRADHVIKVRRGEPTPTHCAHEVPRSTQLVGGARILAPGQSPTVPCGLPLHSKGWQSR